MATTLPSPELREIQRRFKSGYKVESQRGGHFRVVDPKGETVLATNGKVLSLPGTPHGGRQTKNIEAELERAGVLQGTPPRQKPGIKEKRRESMVATFEMRARARQEVADKLYARVSPIVEKVGGAKSRGVMADFAHIGAMIGREMGVVSVRDHMPVTPDVLQTSIHRVMDKGWVTNEYQRIWNELADRLEGSDDQTREFFALLRQAKGLPETYVAPVAQLAIQIGEWPFRVELLKLTTFHIDHTYQRPANWPFIRAKAASFDPTLVGVIDVAERHGGTIFAIMDGQGRYEMMRLVGKTECYAAIYTGLDVQAEAQFFLHKNQDRKAVHPFYTYKAKLTAKDPVAVNVTKIVEGYGYEVSIVSASNAHIPEKISAIASLEEAYGRRNGVYTECLSPTLEVLRASTFGMKDGQSAHLIRALGRMFENFGETVDKHILAQTIANRSPSWLLGKMRELGWTQGSTAPAMLVVLTEEYNRGVPRADRLRLKKR